MWYIFPQIVGLGYTEASYYYGIKSIDEAKEYLNHPVLGNRLREISYELLKLAVNDVNSIFRNPDDLKLKSSMTLFSQMEEREDNIFRQVTDKFFQGVSDNKTLKWTTLRTEADCANILIGAIAGDIIGSIMGLLCGPALLVGHLRL